MDEAAEAVTTRPLDLLDVLDHMEVETGGGSRHAEILTRQGKLTLLFDGPEDADRVLVMCGGALGGLLGPAGGLYFDLARVLAEHGVGSVRVDYRRAGELNNCVLDVAVAIDLAQRTGGNRFVVVGHSFGGAVAISAGAALLELVSGVICLAGQSAGCAPAADLNGTPLLLLHGEDDEIIPVGAVDTIALMAGYGEVVRFPDTGHLLHEMAADLRSRLPRWILGALNHTPGSY
jgi:pimeloyl-ACP methyl ester carboxylesterase